MIREHESLTIAFAQGLHELPPRRADHPGPETRRTHVPLVDQAVRLIAVGQAQGIFRTHPPAYETGTLVINLMFLRALTCAGQHPDATAEISLTTLFGILSPAVLADAGLHGRPFGHPREVRAL